MDQSNEQVGSASESASFESKPKNMALTLAICSGAWLVPGLGHILIGRWIRGFIFAACVLLMFGLGIAMHGKLYDLQFDQPLQFFAFVANIGAGIPYWVAARMGLGIGTMTWPSYDYGTTYLWVCGLLNYLVVLDVFDIAQGRKP
jgi:Family of unknown function (DUF6677)